MRTKWTGRTDVIADVREGQSYLQSGTIEAIVHWLLDHVEYPPPQETKSNGTQMPFFFGYHRTFNTIRIYFILLHLIMSKYLLT